MKIGTKSVLFGAHCFLIHPFFVMVAWIKLYGFPLHPAIWISFFFHDLGYLGKPNMDGKEGETHVELGAKVLGFLFDRRYIIRNIHDIYKDYPRYTKLGYKSVKTFLGYALIKKDNKKWHNFSLYHSRFYAKKEKVMYSKLCVADKLAITLEPAWFYLPRVNWSGEIHEYMSEAKYDPLGLSNRSQRAWFADVCNYLRKWVEEHKDLKSIKIDKYE